MEKLTKENFDNSLSKKILDKLNITEILDAIELGTINKKNISPEELEGSKYRHAMNQGRHEALWDVLQDVLNMLDIDSLNLLYDYETTKIKSAIYNGQEQVANEMKKIRYSIAMKILSRQPMKNSDISMPKHTR